MPKRDTKFKKVELRVFFNERVIDKIDRDLGELGGSRSEVIRNIVEDYYTGKLVSADQVLKALEKREGGT